MKHDLGTALVDARSRAQAVDLRWVVVAECEARIDPVNAVKGYLYGQGRRQVIIRRSIADDADSVLQLSTVTLVADLAIGDHSVIELLIEPRSRDLDSSTAGVYTLSWLNFLYCGVLIVVVLDGRLSEEISVTWSANLS